MKLEKRLAKRHERREHRIRNQIRRNGLNTRPRLSVFRSHNHMYAQIIDDQAGRTLASASTTEGPLRGEYGGNIAAASAVGRLIAERARAAGISVVAFDRGAYKYHGRVQALAEAAREGGLDF